MTQRFPPDLEFHGLIGQMSINLLITANILVFKAGPRRRQGVPGCGYTESDLLCIALSASVKVQSNYSNQAFGIPVDEKFAAYKVA